MGVFVGLPVYCLWNGESDLQAGVEIYYWGHPQILAHFEQPKRPPLGTPISPPRAVNWRPHISMPTGSPDLIPSPASYPVSHWPCWTRCEIATKERWRCISNQGSVQLVCSCRWQLRATPAKRFEPAEALCFQ